MERLTSMDVIRQGFRLMVVDPQCPLDREERTAVLCWLEDVPCEIVILLPEDLLPQLVRYLDRCHPALLPELALEPLGHALAHELLLESPLEIDFFFVWQEEALDLVYPLDLQYPIRHGKYRLDFAYPPLLVGIELDGYTYHSDREQFTKDRQRQREIEMLGWRIIRFSGDELRANMLGCVQEASHFLSIQRFRRERERKDLPHA